MEEGWLVARVEGTQVRISYLKLRDQFPNSNRLGTSCSVESFEGMKGTIPRLRKKLGSDPVYFRRVYLYTFEFARAEGQRSLGLEMALAFWGLLLPHGLKGGALRTQDPGGDDLMKVDGEWTEEHTQLWYEFLGEKNIKGISKDTWAMARYSLSSAILDSPDLLEYDTVSCFHTQYRRKVRDV